NGTDVTTWPMYKRARDGGIGYLAQESSVFRKLSVEQNLLGTMELLGLGGAERRQRCNEPLDQLQLEHLRKANAAQPSGGERRMRRSCVTSDGGGSARGRRSTPTRQYRRPPRPSARGQASQAGIGLSPATPRPVPRRSPFRAARPRKILYPAECYARFPWLAM